MFGQEWLYQRRLRYAAAQLKPGPLVFRRLKSWFFVDRIGSSRESCEGFSVLRRWSQTERNNELPGCWELPAIDRAVVCLPALVVGNSPFRCDSNSNPPQALRVPRPGTGSNHITLEHSKSIECA